MPKKWGQNLLVCKMRWRRLWWSYLQNYCILGKEYYGIRDRNAKCQFPTMLAVRTGSWENLGWPPPSNMSYYYTNLITFLQDDNILCFFIYDLLILNRFVGCRRLFPSNQNLEILRRDPILMLRKDKEMNKIFGLSFYMYCTLYIASPTIVK
jgi:hypothetical protein